MASVFLSYDHEDAAFAAPIAAAIEQAGHSVWWDRHIHGGAEYNSEIEGAVERADAVVVLWSERSVKSAWVRDEAAEGRDSGKLVPVLIDGVKPPMGFRQYQTVDLAAWKGGKQIPKLAELLHAIERVSGSTGLQQQPARGDVTAAVGRWRRLPLAWVGAAAVVVAVALFLLLANPFRGGESAAVAAVVAGDTSPASQELARDLLAQLGELHGAQGQRVQLAGSDSRDDADIIFEVSAAAASRASRANVLLLDGRNGSVVWSKAFETPADRLADLRQQIGYTTALVLGCALDAHVSGKVLLRPDILKLYLTGCATMAESDAERVESTARTFRTVVKAAPTFEAGWRMLVTAQLDLFAATDQGRAQLAADIAAARRINPHMPEAYRAQSALLPLEAYAERMKLANLSVERNPESAAALNTRARALEVVGRMKDAITDTRRAMELEPLSPERRMEYIYALAHGGQHKAALEQMRQAERLWPGASNIAGIRFGFNLRYGDPNAALRYIDSGNSGIGWSEARSYLEARADPTPAKIAAALDDAHRAYRRNPESIFHLSQVYGVFDREKDLLELLLRVPLADAIFTSDVMHRSMLIDFWFDPRSLLYAKRVGLLQYWQSSGKWPDFCFHSELRYDCKKEAARLLA